MKIPGQQPLQVGPNQAQLPVRSVTQPGGFNALEQGVGQLGQMADTVAAVYEKQRREAQAKQATDLVTKYQAAETDADYGSTVTPTDPNAAVPDVTKMSEQEFGTFLEGPKTQQIPGFLSTKGEGALADVDRRDADLEKRRQEIAKEAKDPTVKKRYLEETGRMYEASKRRARGHVAQELERAKEDSLKDGLAKTLRAVSEDPMNEEIATIAVAGLSGRAAAMATSTENADAKVDAIRAEVAATRAEVLIRQKKWDAAEMVVRGSEKVLGKAGAAFMEKIEDGRAGADAQGLASAAVAGSLREDLSVDEDKLRAEIEKVPEDMRQKVEEATKAKVILARQAYDAGTKRLLSEAVASYNANGWSGMPKELKDRLQNRRDDPQGPLLYKSLEHGDDVELDRLERKARIRNNNSAAKAQQEAIDHIAKKEWEQKILLDPKGADLELFLVTHRGISDQAKSDLPVMQTKLQQQHDKGLLSNRSQFIKQATDAAAGFIAARVGRRTEKDAATLERNDFEAAAGRTWDAWVSDGKHERGPLPAEVKALTSDIILNYVRRSGAPLKPNTPDAAIRHGQNVVDQVVKAGQEERDYAISRIKQSGRPVTEELINQVMDYERKKRQKAK